MYIQIIKFDSWVPYAKAEKDKTQKQSQRMKNNLNRCVLAF